MMATEREPEMAGQTVVVIGGSAGMGPETARRARAEGADVILTGRDRTAAGDGLRRGGHALSEHVVLALEVARNALGKMRPGGTLLFMGGTGGRRVGHGLGIVRRDRPRCLR
ncbi:MAG: hypothetical protein ACRDOK_10120 [Streptosporangiaceae bacterium]